MSRRLPFVAIALGTGLFWPGAVRAQIGLLHPSQPFTLRGEVGTVSELYQAYGIDPRRPWGTQQLFFNPSMTLVGSLTLSANLLVSTEQGSTVGLHGLPGRQRLNDFGLHPTWSWGRAHAGSFSEMYSPRTLAGLRIRGADVELNPGLLRFGVFGGSAQRAVFGGLTSGAYSRRIIGGRVGIGRERGGRDNSFLQLMVVRAWDDQSSLPSPTDSNAPSLPSDVPANPFAVTPQDNVVAGLSGGIALLAGKLFVKGEVDASAHTRDRRAAPLAKDALNGYPGFLQGIMTPRLGTHGDFAYSGEATLRLPTLPGATRRSPRSLIATLGYQYMGPGYVSLGTPSLFNDYRKIDASTALRIGRAQLRLNGHTQRDNVLGQKLATTTRSRLAGMFTMQASRRWTAAFNASWLGMHNDAIDAMRVGYTNWMLGTAQSFSFSRQARVTRIAFTYALQMASDANPLRIANRLRSHTLDSRVTVRLTERIQLTPSGGLQLSRAGTEAWATRATYGLAGQWRSRRGTWTVVGTATSARYSMGTDALRGGVTVRWRATAADVLSFSARSSHYSDAPTERGSFDEHLMTLRWSRRF
jgi:hypothetical protein